MFRALALPSWRHYARRHGYEIVCFENPLDESERARARSPAWQKLLVLGQPELASFDTVVWLDTDIAINCAAAPCIAQGVDDGMLGICEETELPDLPLFASMRHSLQLLHERHRLTNGIELGAGLYAANGFTDPPAQIFNTGVMVLSRPAHREFLEQIYARYEDKGPGGALEMGALSYNIARGAVPCQVLDPRFNALWFALSAWFGNIYQRRIPVLDGRAALIAAMLSKVYFLHFAGHQIEMRDIRLLEMHSDRIVLNEAAIRKEAAAVLNKPARERPSNPTLPRGAAPR
jgi:hypothetical protein